MSDPAQMGEAAQAEAKANILSLVPWDGPKWFSIFMSVSKTDGEGAGRSSLQSSGAARTHMPFSELTCLPDCHNLPSQLDKGPGGAQPLAHCSPSLFLSTCPGAGHVAKVKTLISAEPRPAASLRSLSVNGLQEGSYTGGDPPDPVPSASSE